MVDLANPRAPGSESGLIGVGTVIAIAIAVLFAYLLLGAFEADSAHYGSVPIPSSGATVELEKGETDVYYAEAIDPGSGAPLTPPADLNYLLTGSDGEVVRVDSRGGDPKGTDGGAARVIGAAFVPADGTYTVEVASEQLAQRVAPAITFGQSPIGAIQDRFANLVDQFKGPLGILVVLGLAILFMIPRIGRARRS